MPAKEQFEKLKKYYAEELKRKDKIIEELKEQNTLIMKSAMKQSEKLTHLSEKLKKFVGKKK
jgi:hypothetical protein